MGVGMFGAGVLVGEGGSTVSSESLKETEQLTAPDFTSFLCVLQIWLYCWLSLLGGTGAILHTLPTALFVVRG